MLRAVLLVCAAALLLLEGSRLRAQERVALTTDIPPESLAQALAACARQTGLQIVYVSGVVRGRQSQGAPAGLAPEAVLTRLLEGTDLRFEFVNPRTVRIYAAPTESSAARLASVAQRHTAEPFRSLSLEEVVVTATRREEQLSQVPIDMAVWTEEAMETARVKGISQIAALTPGIDFDFLPHAGGDYYTSLAIRGVTERHGATVGVYLDDTLIPPAWSVTYLRAFPVAFDVDRVEVLRGPQATLLGDHTQGGAVRFVTNQPSLTEFTGLARSELSTTAHGGTSYELGAAAGGPLIPGTLGFRVSGWYRSDGGYVDRFDPLTGATVEPNSNRYVSKSVRAAVTFASEGSVRVTPSVTYQSINIDDTSSFCTDLSSPGNGVLRNCSPVAQPFDDTFYLAAAKVNVGFSVADLSSVTSYFNRMATNTTDYTYYQGPSSAFYTEVVTGYVWLTQRVFSQEMRLTSAASQDHLRWLAGIFFSSEHSHRPDRYVGIDQIMGSVDLRTAPAIERVELAGFGEIALKLTKSVTASAGLRVGRSKYDFVNETAYVFPNNAPPILHAADADTWTAPRFVLSYQSDEHNLIYLTAAKGYGSGGVYLGFAECTDNPGVYAPDTLWSYEMGTKNGLLGGRLQLDTGVFHIRWNNGPQGYNFCENAVVPGAAVSNGFDLAAQALATEHLRASLAIAYTDARYTQPLSYRTTCCGPPGDTVTARSGDVVGAGAPWSVTGSIELVFPLRGGFTASLWAEDAFHSRNPGPFYEQDPASQYYTAGWRANPATNLLNARASGTWSGFEVAAFINNVMDSQPTLGHGAGITLTPRTAGLSGTWRF